MRRAALVLFALGLCSCGTSRDVYTADGSIVHVISCHAQSLGSCLERAGEICGPLGYKFASPDGAPMGADGVGKVNSGFMLERKIDIKCGH
jgi:hypothetical protein